MDRRGFSVTVRDDLGVWWVNHPGHLAGVEDIREWRSDGEMELELAVMGYNIIRGPGFCRVPSARMFDLEEIA